MMNQFKQILMENYFAVKFKLKTTLIMLWILQLVLPWILKLFHLNLFNYKNLIQ